VRISWPELNRNAFSSHNSMMTDSQWLLAFEQAGDGMMKICPQGRILDANAAAARMLGYSHEALVTLSHGDLLKEIDTDSIMPTVAPDSPSLPQEREYRHKGGSSVVVEVRLTVLSDGSSLAVLREVDERRRREGALHESEKRLRLAVEAAHLGTFDWDMVSNRMTRSRWNEELWRFTEGQTVCSFETFSSRLHPDDLPDVVREIQACVAASKPFVREFRVLAQGGGVRWVLGRGEFQLNATGQPRRMLGVLLDITQQKRAESERHQLTAQLLESENEERRRIARELHDTTAQNLAAAKMNLIRLQAPGVAGSPGWQQWLSDSLALIEQSMREIRTLTYVLHPPLLEELGLAKALQDFAVGFSRRSELQVQVDVGGYSKRLSLDLEMALFRVVQESLSNALRHSGCTSALIRLESDEEEVRLEVQDNGRGLPAANGEARIGVGLRGMQERLCRYGGRLEIESDAEGTTVLAALAFSLTDHSKGTE
jgi:PAS domain S-box-containing protein